MTGFRRHCYDAVVLGTPWLGPDTNVVDLMSALRASLSGKRPASENVDPKNETKAAKPDATEART